jgi:hypothetical protein
LGLISRLICKNEKKGYIYRELLKVENKKRKQNAFFLTNKGIKLATELTKYGSNSGVGPKIMKFTQKKIVDIFLIIYF